METPNEVNLVAEGSKTKMVAAKLVKVKCLRPFLIGERTVLENQIVEIPEDRAKELCDKEYRGTLAFTGERWEQDGDVLYHRIKNAVRV